MRREGGDKMKRALIIGSIVCCIPGLWLLVVLICDIIEYWDHFLHNVIGYEHDILLTVLYATLSCVPAIVLFKARHTEMSRVKIAITGILEVVLICVLWTVFFNFGT
jgi:hypothetical protein